ncbi:MAG: hypothetical protein RL637_1575 [Pseudomonadota bacterium]
MNKLLLGDNLAILKEMESESVDLIYLDPPFFSNRNYEVIWGDKGEIRSFEDRWAGGINHYIEWLKERVIEMHRILKSTGSIFLHCDWHANAYIRVLILDRIFGENNFRNEIIWHYTGRRMESKIAFNSKHDVIFFYAKSKQTCIKNYPKEEYTRDSYVKMKKQEVHCDEDGREWIWGHAGKGKSHHYKIYIDEAVANGRAVDDVWDIPIINTSSKEKIGYPTQKPEALLERIIQCASNENDIVLDPFVGGGTTIAVADKLNRYWIGIDSSVQAIKVSEMRLQKNQIDIFAKPFIVQLHKYDYDTLRYKDAFEFESFIIQQFGGLCNTKQRGDLGIDGKTRDNIPIQVKRSDNIGRNVIDNFKSAIERFDKSLFDRNKTENKTAGILIAFSFGKGAIEEIARLKSRDGIIIKLVKVEEIVPIAKKPKLSLTFTDNGLNSKNQREILFIAKGESEAGIEFYAWDFNFNAEKGFKADIMIDKIGTQIQSFKIGSYQIAVKVVDNEGLENIEILKLKINGEVSELNL